MKETPLLMCGEMILATLEDRKTQTRRVIKQQWSKCLDIEQDGDIWKISGDKPTNFDGEVQMNDWSFDVRCPYGQPGDRLWVRETWGCPAADHPNVKGGRKPQQGDKIVYRANPSDDCQWGSGKPSQGSFCWRPSIFMPRWASRITLEITDVRVQRVQEISEQDAMAEGVNWKDNAGLARFTARKIYQTLWDSLNAKRKFSGGYQEIRGMAWKDNPWVWAIAFRRVK